MNDLAFTLLVVVGLAGALGAGLWWLITSPAETETQHLFAEGKE
ncbi:hypothetical protein [Saccharopolyspora sp. ASAGF58]|nr:hypothetical protein [Saccharopolyspora sp. ASAGF58]